MNHFIPATPWENPVLSEIRLAARIKGINRIDSGDGGSEIFEITLWIVDEQKYLKTRVCLPSEFSNRCQMRLKFFCYAIGMQDCELNENPQEAVDRVLAVELETTSNEKVNNGIPFSDVKKFLRSEILKETPNLNIR